MDIHPLGCLDITINPPPSSPMYIQFMTTNNMEAFYTSGNQKP
jgi:hypothetical protein